MIATRPASDIDAVYAKLLSSNVIERKGLRDGIVRYLKVQDELVKTPDVGASESFQALFKSFYGMRFKKGWYAAFFVIMQRYRTCPSSFEEVLIAIAEKSGSCEASFASKLCATLDPTLPVIDSKVLAVLQQFLPTRGNWKLLTTATLPQKMACAIEVHRSLNAVIGLLKEADTFTSLIERFDCHHGKLKLTATKKLDLLLWQLR